jgi:tetratricopeptide (TPR) repeat protein
MKRCPHCRERFQDNVSACLYCDGPLEIIEPLRQKTPVKQNKKEQSDTKTGKKWKEFCIPIITTIIIVVILFTISQIKYFNKNKEQVTEFKSMQMDAHDASTPVHASISEPALSPDPLKTLTTAIILYNNAFALCSSGKCTDPQKAIEYLDEAIKLKPDLAEAYNIRGNADGDLGQHQRAIEAYNEAIRLRPNYAHAYYNRGLTYSNLGQHQQAIEDYNEAIRLNIENNSVYHNRGKAYFIQGNKELGCRDAQKACELGDCKLLEDAKSKKACP